LSIPYHKGYILDRSNHCFPQVCESCGHDESLLGLLARPRGIFVINLLKGRACDFFSVPQGGTSESVFS